MVLIAMTCEDPEDHKFIKNKKWCISNPTGRIKDSIQKAEIW